MNFSNIYALRDPRNSRIMYIGLTNRNIKTRYTEHLCHAKNNNENYSVSRWVRELLSNKLKPELCLLATPYRQGATSLEEELIKHYSRLYPIVNTAIGVGASGVKWSNERMEKMIKSEYYKNLRLRMSGKNNPMKNPEILKKAMENQRKVGAGYQKRRETIMANSNWGKWGCRPILQCDLSGSIIKEWESTKLASQELNICASGITQCCLGHKMYKKSGGFVWKYKFNNNYHV